MEKIYRKWQIVIGDPNGTNMTEVHFTEGYAVLRCKEFRKLGERANVYEVQMNFDKNTKKIIPILEEI